MVRTPRNCPRCGGTIELFRTRPGPYPLILGHQLWRCSNCEFVHETANVIVSSRPGRESKEWIYSLESPEQNDRRHLRRQERHESDSEESDSKSDGETR